MRIRHGTPVTRATDQAVARVLDDDRQPRRRVADGSLLSRTDPAPWHEWEAVGAFLDAPYATWPRGEVTSGCTDQGCSGIRSGSGAGGFIDSLGASAVGGSAGAPGTVAAASGGGKGAPDTLPADFRHSLVNGCARVAKSAVNP